MPRVFYLAVGYLSLALAVVGLFLPVLPTTPFLLVAVWAFARSDPALAARLYAHPAFGHLLTAWRDEGAIPLRAKLMAVATLAASGGVTAFYVEETGLTLFILVVLTLCGLYLITRPSPGSCNQQPRKRPRE